MTNDFTLPGNSMSSFCGTCERIKARIAVLEAALRDVCSDVAISRFTSVEQARAALSAQPAATGEGEP